MNILITGGAGFIGSALIRYLANIKDINIVNIDKLTYAGNLSSLSKIKNPECHIHINEDICNQKNMLEILKKYKPDAVMHLAAESHVDRSISGPEEFLRTNIMGTFSMLEACREYFHTLPSKDKDKFRLHHISTDEVFGDLENEYDLFTETTPYAPSSPYSASKASSDHLVRAWHRTYALPIIITNCSNNYGPYQYPEKLIPLVILNAIRGYDLPIYGDGCQIRDWLYVDDHAKALFKVLKFGSIGETYNIGGHNEIKNIDVVNSICKILDEINPKKNGKYSDQITFVEDRSGHDQRYAIDATKIKNNINWMPEESFESGIKKTVDWYMNNEWWWSIIEDKKT